MSKALFTLYRIAFAPALKLNLIRLLLSHENVERSAEPISKGRYVPHSWREVEAICCSKTDVAATNRFACTGEFFVKIFLSATEFFAATTHTNSV